MAASLPCVLRGWASSILQEEGRAVAAPRPPRRVHPGLTSQALLQWAMPRAGAQGCRGLLQGRPWTIASPGLGPAHKPTGLHHSHLGCHEVQGSPEGKPSPSPASLPLHQTRPSRLPSARSPALHLPQQLPLSSERIRECVTPPQHPPAQLRAAALHSVRLREPSPHPHTPTPVRAGADPARSAPSPVLTFPPPHKSDCSCAWVLGWSDCSTSGGGRWPSCPRLCPRKVPHPAHWGAHQPRLLPSLLPLGASHTSSHQDGI